MISVLIVTYNSARCIGACLESIRQYAGDAEIIVVDNASHDDTVETVRRFSGVKLIASPANLGFAAAVNRAARESRGDALLILNPDTVLRNSLQPLADTLADTLHDPKRIAAVAPCLVDSAGNFQRSFAIRRLPSPAALLFEILLINRLLPNNPVNRRYRALDFAPTRVTEVEQPAGACLMVRRASFEAVGGMDEAFFPLWFEDVDFCRRLRAAGGSILFCPAATVEHSGGHSVESISFSEKQVYWYRNLLYYIHKHHGWGFEALARVALLVGLGLRGAAELIAAVLNRCELR